MSTNNAINNVQMSDVLSTVYTANATHNFAATTQFVFIQAQGGGGAGGGTGDTTVERAQAGVGGQGGNYAESFYPIASLPSSLALTIGAGGAGVPNANGSAGGATAVDSLFTVRGGAGGGRTSATANYGIAGTAPVAGTLVSGTADRTVRGSAGGVSTAKGGVATDCFAWAGFGGVSQMSTGAGGNRGRDSAGVTDGLDADTAGAGGGGACSIDDANNGTGGNGADGMVIITEYLAL